MSDDFFYSDGKQTVDARQHERLFDFRFYERELSVDYQKVEAVQNDQNDAKRFLVHKQKDAANNSQFEHSAYAHQFRKLQNLFIVFFGKCLV